MSSHEAHTTGQRAFAAMREQACQITDSKLLVTEGPQHFDDTQALFDQLGISFETVTVRLASGATVPAFRISTAAFIFLGTLNLINSN